MQELLLSVDKKSNQDSAYLGYVPPGDFITAQGIVTTLALTQGAVNNTEGWLKFKYESKILYIFKRHVAYGVPWNTLNSKGAVFGTTTVTINELVYKVRLIKGGNSDPSTGAGGEWNDLIMPLVYGEPKYFTDVDLGNDPATNRGTICQETILTNSNNCVARGNGSSATANYQTAGTPKTYNQVFSGYRPVLELII